MTREPRKAYHDELEQLRLQVELMGVRVDQNLERMREVLGSGNTSIATTAIQADDDIDDMNLSLTERCYDLLARETPVADELRFVVSVLRILSELERVGDLALRVVKLNPDRRLWTANEVTFDILLSMADTALDAYRTALRAWSSQDLGLATEIANRVHTMDVHYERLMAELLRLQGPDAVRTATTTLIAGRSLERIADHAAIVGARLQYLLTGDPEHLSAEVR
ncbi:phosphate signaling complex protein PhoU [Actinospongicola halichondriae]|uniref:phosphate signaling complex protein PhoU n=1 Tax=Actinospongicola halichondriae TaxID=3236844 RepID=UPI003D3B3317